MKIWKELLLKKLYCTLISNLLENNQDMIYHTRKCNNNKNKLNNKIKMLNNNESVKIYLDDLVVIILFHIFNNFDNFTFL